ncbi:hypothetical protein AAHN97_28085 [Chitinophaga niabensis]|uniref:hypothetical protein n=1 Tax=Chitinophaga niabensis TaxID=536979 RepID=UPI0031BA75C8
MKQFLASTGFIFLLTFNARSQSLQTVTDSANTTSNAIWITGFAKYNQDVNGIGMYYVGDKGYLDALNPRNATYLPLMLRGSSIEYFTNGGGHTFTGGNFAFTGGNVSFTGGNVGMGTAAVPNYKLITKGPVWSSAPMGTVTSASIPNFYVSADDPGVSDFEVYTNTTATYMGPYLNKPLVFVRNVGIETMRIDQNGNVGIGTSAPNGYKLAVAGTAIAQKVKVTAAAASWPDYVFHKGYVLPSLQEVAAYIATHQHLPEIPSAAEIEKNGQDLGEMNKQLLKKVEELTLYIIQQQKETEGLKERVKALEKK